MQNENCIHAVRLILETKLEQNVQSSDVSYDTITCLCDLFYLS